MMDVIESPHNAKFKNWLTLLEGRGIRKSGRVLLSGHKLITEFLRQRPQEAEELLTSPKLTQLVPPEGVRTYSLATPLFQKLDIFGTQSPLLIARQPQVEKWPQGAPSGLELI